MSKIKQVFPPDLTDILEEQKKDIFKSLNCVKVGIIETFDTSDQTASVKLSIKRILGVNPDGSKLLQEYPVLLKCPVVILTGGDSHLTFPIVQGDDCMVLFNDRDIDNWFLDGSIDPANTNRLHDLSDGLVIIGARNISSAISDYLTDGVRLRFDADTRIDLRTENILIRIATASINVITNAINSIATLWTHTGNFTATGEVSDSNATTPTMIQMRNVYNGHTHGGGPVPTQQM